MQPDTALLDRLRTDAAPRQDAGDDQRLLASLRSGSETAFVELVDRYHASLVRLAISYVHDRAVAEEATQDAWLAFLRGLDRFEGRSSLKSWLFGILVNCARSRARRERRSLPFSAVWETTPEASEPAVAPERFRGPADQWPGGWVSFPRSWGELPEEVLLSREVRRRAEAAIDALPPSQRQVVLLRDVQGCTSAEVCALLSISEVNQRVLLHRGRSSVRQVLEDYLSDAVGAN